MYHHSRIVAKLPVQLARADVYRVNALTASLQEAIREAAGGGPDVQASQPGSGNAEGVQCGGQLHSGAADVRSASGDLDAARDVDAMTGLAGFLALHKDLASHDQSL